MYGIKSQKLCICVMCAIAKMAGTSNHFRLLLSISSRRRGREEEDPPQRPPYPPSPLPSTPHPPTPSSSPRNKSRHFQTRRVDCWVQILRHLPFNLDVTSTECHITVKQNPSSLIMHPLKLIFHSSLSSNTNSSSCL